MPNKSVDELVDYAVKVNEMLGDEGLSPGERILVIHMCQNTYSTQLALDAFERHE